MGPSQVFIESNTTGTGRRFASIAARLGHRPLLIASEPDRYPYVAEDELDTIVADTSRVDELLRICRELSASEGLVGVGSSSEYFIEPSARVARELGLPGPDPEAVVICRDKLAQRERFLEHGVGSPAFRIAYELEEGLAAAAEIGYPLVVKPREGSGSIGVLLCADEAQLRPQLARLVAAECNERGIPIQRGALLEQAISGDEFSVEVFDGRARALVRKHLGQPPFFVETGHDYPAQTGEPARAAICREAERAVAALGLGFGPAHVELRMGADGPKLIEVNPRLAGGWIPGMIQLASGVDLVEQTVRRLAGLALDLEPSSNLHASIRFLLFGARPQAGAIEAARTLQGVHEVSLYPARPGVSERLGDFRDRIGHVLCVGSSRGEVDDSLRAAFEALYPPAAH